MEPAVGERIIVLVDMDCFYVQVEQKLCPEYDNKPCAVAQYNNWEGGGIIAVNYEARAFGVKRGMRGDVAKKLCSELHNFRVPEVRGKADLTRYRDAGAAVMEVLCEFCDCVERASVDEAYLDLTSCVLAKMKDFHSLVSAEKVPNTHIIGWDKDAKDDDVSGWLQSIHDEETMLSDQKLALAAVLVEEIRCAVYDRTRFRCSAGIAHNKMLAKLACGLHKPNKQTVLPHSSVPILYESLPINKVRNLGGKLGEEVQEKLGIETMGELMNFTEAQLSMRFGCKTGSWLYSISKGVDHELVTARQLPKSIGCGKNFPGKQALESKYKISHWLEQLATELNERLQKDQFSNKRVAKSLTVSLRIKEDNQVNAVSRTCPIHAYDTHKIANDAMQAIQKLNTASANGSLWRPPIIALSIVASKFEDTLDSCTSNIRSFFSPVQSKNTQDASVSGDTKCENENAVAKDLNSNFQLFDQSTIPISHKSPIKTIDSFFSRGAANCSKSSASDESITNPKTGEMENDANHHNLESSAGTSMPNVVDLTTVQNQSETKMTPPVNDVSNVHDSKPMGFFARKLKEKEAALKEVQDTKNSKPLDFFGQKSKKSQTTRSSEVHDSLFTNGSANTSTIFSLDISLNSSGVRNNEYKEPDNATASTSKTSPHEIEGNETPAPKEQRYSEYELSPEISVLCSKCNERIPCWEEQEHEDFHLALEMQEKMDMKPNVVVPRSKNTTKASTKRTSSKKSQAAQKKSRHHQKTLDVFMK